MNWDILLQTLLSGILIGMVYALVAVGLSIIYGVMEIVNFAHGEFLMFGMYSSFWLFTLFALDPMLTLPLSALFLFALGALVYRFTIKRIASAPMVSQIFATFGLMILFRGVAQFLWKPDFRTVENSLVSGNVVVGGLYFGIPHLVAAVGAVLATGAVWWFINRTRLGAALEATAQDKEAAQLMGIPSHWMFALAWGLGAACAGVAGVLLSTFFPIFPEVGATFSLIAFVVVALGGFGNVTGALWAGIIVGVVEVLGGFLIGPEYKLAIVLTLFLLVIIVRPQGLMGRAE
ncbi:MAG: branched-chain amino acid ABC transporter permease [Candidatus Accumulibacter sp.]|jgi:branched-chain amino acid transport system permease protein|nr:branched-chain amino acid ABC transporter permease [Accumulibacter sp.]